LKFLSLELCMDLSPTKAKLCAEYLKTATHFYLQCGQHILYFIENIRQELLWIV